MPKRSHSLSLRGFGHVFRYQINAVLLEATGGYERGVLKALQDARLPVSRINPKRARAFALAMGKHAKTDPIDAAVLAHMAEVMPPAPCMIVTPERIALRELLHQRERFVQQRDDDKRRLKQVQLDSVRRRLETHITYLKGEIKALEKEIAQQGEALHDERTQRLIQVKGIGMVTACNLVAPSGSGRWAMVSRYARSTSWGRRRA